MDLEDIRLLISAKLADGRLPLNSIPRVWGGPGDGEMCDACGEIITKDQLVMEGVSVAEEPDKRAVQFHTKCFYLWDTLRRD